MQHCPLLEGVCYALAPGYQAEVLRLALRQPLDLAAFNHAVREALVRLRLPYCFIIAPTVPQLGPDFASIVIVPKWLPQAGRQVVVYDFRDLGGPVYARIVHERVSHQECLQEAAYHGHRACSIYVQGHSRELETGDTFLATLGGVIQFRPQRETANWCCTLPARFDRPQWWREHPQLPETGREWPVLVLHGDGHTLYSAARFPTRPTLQFWAGLVGRSPDRVLFISPPGNGLTDVEFRGVPCRDALCVYPLAPSPEREGILVFLDPRQAGSEVTHIYLASTAADPHMLVRYLGLRPPPCYRIAMTPRPGRAGVLHLSEGDVVVFGFKEDNPWSTSEEDSSDQEDQAESEAAPDHSSDVSVLDDEHATPSGSVNGPPPPIPVHSTGNAPAQHFSRSRSRSPRDPPRRIRHGTREGSGSLSARSALSVALLAAQPENVEGGPVLACAAPAETFQYLLLFSCGILAVLAICFASWSFGPRSRALGRDCKLLQEPTGGSQAERRDLRRLRSVTRRLGGRWPTDHPLRVPGLVHVHEGDGISSSGSEEDSDLMYVSCAVISLDYVAEQVGVVLPIPATPLEVMTALHDVRSHDTAIHFPQLVSVLPQPSIGIAVFVAQPPWPGGPCLVCLDTTAIDGRLFVAAAPEYACKADFISLSGVLPHLDYDVCFNSDQEPVGERPVQLYQGALITIVYAGAALPAQYALGDLLQSRLAWGTPMRLPQPSYADARCLIFQDETRLCVDAMRAPPGYREVIAQATGADPQRMRLYAAALRESDAAVQGVPCPTLIAVGQPPSAEPWPIWHCAILDCRPLAAQWKVIYVQRGTVLQRTLFAALQRHSRPGWTMLIDGKPETDDVLWLAPGQVVVATLTQDHAQPRTTHADSPDPALPAPDGHDPVPADGPTDMPETADDAEADVEAHEQQFRTAFLVCVPDYAPESIVVDLPLPCSPVRAFQGIQALRDERRRQWFPRLIPVSHQPYPDTGIVLALPPWEGPNVTILVHNGFAANRVFAAVAPPLPQRHLLLGMVGLPAHHEAHVYVKDLPWPLTDGITVALEHGDIVSIQPPTHDFIVLADLSDMLVDRRSWTPQMPFPFPRQGHLWLLTDEGSRLWQFDRNRAERLHRDLAGLLHTPEADLRIRPCRPNFPDLAHQGFLIEAALIATALDIRLTEAGSGLFPYVLDLRPILRGVEWRACSTGVINLHYLSNRFAHLCPPRSRVVCLGGRPEPPPFQHFLRFSPGEVLIVCFEQIPLRSWDGAEAGDNGVDARSTPLASPASHTPPGAASAVGPEAAPQPAPAPANGTVHAMLTTKPCTADADSLLRSLGFLCKTSGCVRANDVEANPAPDLLPSSVTACHRLCAASFLGNWADRVIMWTVGLSAAVHLCGPPPDTSVLSARNAQSGSVRQGAVSSSGRNGTLFGHCAFNAALSRLLWTVLPGTAFFSGCLSTAALCIFPALLVWRRSTSFLFMWLLAAAGIQIGAIRASAAVCSSERHDRHPASLPAGLPASRPGGFRSKPTPVRPVPTPCRAQQPHGGRRLFAVAGVDSLADHTLLREAARQPGCTAFLDARALLETLLEHFQPSAGTTDVADAACNACGNRSPRKLVLADLVHRSPGLVAPSATAADGDNNLEPIFIAPFRWPSLPGHLTWFDEVCIGTTPLGFTMASLHQLFAAAPALVPLPRVPAETRTTCSCALSALRHDFQRMRADSSSAHVWIYTDGSFTPACKDKPAYAGWAAICIDPHRQQASLASGPVLASLWGDEELTPYLAECFALAAAGLLAITAFSCRPIIFLSDCTAAVGGASGQHTHRLQGIPHIMSSVHVFRTQVCAQADQYRHIPGHQGIPGNELADVMSKTGARSKNFTCGIVVSGDVLSRWFVNGGRLLSWAALAVRSLRGDSTVPPLNSALSVDPPYNANLSPAQILAPFLPPGAWATEQHATSAAGVDARQHKAASYRLCVNLATFNVLSLGKPSADRADPATGDVGLAYQPARAALLAAQLKDRRVQVAFLQETRADPGLSRVGDYIRLASGAVRGQFGTEVWFQARHAILRGDLGDEDTDSFTKERFTVLESDERRLLVRFSGRQISILFVGLHAPHRAHERCTIDAWWRDTRQLVDRHLRQSCLVLGGDMNAALGSVTTPQVGDVAPEDQDLAGEYLHGLAKEYGLYFPATMHACHSGPSFTYIQKHGGAHCRPDFIAIPMDWSHGKVASRCDAAIHAAHSTPDHVAARVDVEARFAARPATVREGQRTIRATDVTNPAHRATIVRLLHSAPIVPWDVSVHAHAALITAHVQAGLQALASTSTARPHHPYLHDTTWQLHREASDTRRELHRLTAVMRCNDLAVGFKAWAYSLPLRAVLRGGGRWLAVAQRTRHQLHCRLTDLCKRLKKACRQDRDRYIEQLAATISVSPSKEAFRAYHQVLAHRRKKAFRLDPLPQVTQLGGEVCEDADQMARRWREHFSALEAGQATTFRALAEEGSDNIGVVGPHPDNITDIPGLPDLRRVLAATKTGKASGMESIPPELGRHFSSDTANLLYPLLLKIIWGGVEPVGFKGGRAIILYKGRGSTTSCASYRSILLTPSWSKTFHQSLRPAIRAVFEQSAPSMQIGGRRGCSVTYGSHVLRACQRYAVQNGHSCFVLFADISAAFYSALVQFIAQAGTSATQQSLTQALEGLACPPEVHAELRHMLAEPSVLTQLQASPWLEHISAQISSDNWFLLADDNVPVRTARGTRPGTSWADILFALLMPRILRKRDTILGQLRTQARRPAFLWDGDYSLDPPPPGAPQLSLQEVIWADDLAIPKICHAPADVEPALRAEATALTEAFYSYGFKLSFGDHKTAAVVTLFGRRSRGIKQRLYGNAGLKGKIPILLEHLPTLLLPLPAKYKHLGVFQAPAGCVRDEIKHRVAHARSAFAEARRKVYKSRAIALKRKATLLSSTVLSRLLQGAGAWPPLTGRDYHLFSGAVWGFYRGVVNIPYGGDQHLTAHTCFSILQLPAPSTLLRLSRLSYLEQLVRSGPPEVWAALRADQPYAEMFRGDLRWLFAWTWATSPLPHPDCNWGLWRAFIAGSPGRFKGLCRRAKSLTTQQHTTIAALDGLYRALSCLTTPTSNAGVVPDRPCELCLPCKRGFFSRVSWAGHAARKHNYRSQAYLLPQDNVCRCCGKAFASVGRLRRHLTAAPGCLLGWGSFVPLPEVVNAKPHELAPPAAVLGASRGPPVLPTDDGVHDELLQQLFAQEGAAEADIWQTVEACIAPLATLRLTVQAWAQDDLHSTWRSEVAENVLLLLDPAVTAETQQRPPQEPTRDLEAVPLWPSLQPIPLTRTGQVLTLDLAPPPARLIGPTCPGEHDAPRSCCVCYMA